jgi:cytochrome P450
MTATENVEYNPFAPGFYDDAFSVYRWMRDQAPVYYSERWGWWALTRFEDVRAAMLGADTFRSFEGMDIDDTEAEQAGPGSLPNMDNPRHDEIRGIVQPWFLPRRIGAHEDNVRAVVRGLIARWRDRGAVDLAQELAWPMPFEVFFSIMGMPATEGKDREQLERWVHELKGREPGSPHLTPTARAATAGINAYFVELLEDRRRTPQQDLVSYIVQAEINGLPFTDGEIEPASEVLGLMMVLFLAGVESTAGLTGSLFKLLAENPDQRARLVEDPTLIAAAVEEAVRYATPLQLMARTTSRDVVLHGVTIPAGGRVVLVAGAANRDERRYPNADTFDVTRGIVRNLGFGEGVHGCLGAHLARLETRIAVEEALPVLGEYELAGTPVFYPSSPNMYVWKNLPMSFDPAGLR